MIINSFAVLMDSLLEQKCLFLNFLSLPESHIRNVLLTSMHSSRVRTARLLTPYPVLSRGGSAQKGCAQGRERVSAWGCLPRDCLPRRVYPSMQWSRYNLVDSILDTRL